VTCVEQLEVVDARLEQPTGLLERDAVLGLVGEVLGFIPRKPH